MLYMWALSFKYDSNSIKKRCSPLSTDGLHLMVNICNTIKYTIKRFLKVMVASALYQVV